MDMTITFQPSDRAAWRNWLEQHHASSQEIWLVTSKQSPSLKYLEAVQEALCFGWIVGIAKRLGRFLDRTKQNKWNISEFCSPPM
jgi:uncharacterized protein YdeI (YjbR/CyaY-like superfamily)